MEERLNRPKIGCGIISFLDSGVVRPSGRFILANFSSNCSRARFIRCRKSIQLEICIRSRVENEHRPIFGIMHAFSETGYESRLTAAFLEIHASASPWITMFMADVINERKNKTLFWIYLAWPYGSMLVAIGSYRLRRFMLNNLNPWLGVHRNSPPPPPPLREGLIFMLAVVTEH